MRARSSSLGPESTGPRSVTGCEAGRRSVACSGLCSWKALLFILVICLVRNAAIARYTRLPYVYLASRTGRTNPIGASARSQRMASHGVTSHGTASDGTAKVGTVSDGAASDASSKQEILSQKEVLQMLRSPGGPKFVICEVRNGLGNRLRALGSAMAFARRTARPLLVVWVPDLHCDCGFRSFFEGPLGFTLVEEGFSGWQLKPSEFQVDKSLYPTPPPPPSTTPPPLPPAPAPRSPLLTPP